MIAMRSYIILVSKGALSDLDGIAQYVSSLHRPESGHKYVTDKSGTLFSDQNGKVFNDYIHFCGLKKHIVCLRKQTRVICTR